MPEDKREIKVYKTEYVCDQCGKGPMKFVIEVVDDKENWKIVSYRHRCITCNSYADFPKRYPVREFRSIPMQKG